MIKQLLERILPKYTKRRLAIRLAFYAAKRPWRIHQRINPTNILLFREFNNCQAHCAVCDHRGSLFFEMPDLKLRGEHGIGLFREVAMQIMWQHSASKNSCARAQKGSA
jgi:hypothetical protein